ncbi:elongation factor Ts [Actinorhabdospora filicis]|uniref:Elongation factor Ts n=1 Tax=Actinorhabdospora filicis TaxID=1785913 RepID=A0A9W6SHP7_9ACTN|nr:translation elongation factor Ts [Actinorhabdospora filicis]GLZ75654.1 elongation factor Ts [Actinorhabdospora filicis]
MANFTIQDIKKLREMTGSGMTDVKKALAEADGDFDKAVEILRIKGAKDVGKRQGRTAANGLIAQSGNALLELNCETDFVAKNGAFIELAQSLIEHVAATKPADLDALLGSELNGKPVADVISEESAKIGEKIVLSRFAVVAGDVAVYMHRKAEDLPPQVGVLVSYEGGDGSAARDAGMQVAAMRPKWTHRDEVPAEDVENERRIAEQTAREEGKPEQAITKIVEGRVNSFFKDFVLLEQSSVKEPKKSVEAVLKDQGVTVKGFVRFEVGQA